MKHPARRLNVIIVALICLITFIFIKVSGLWTPPLPPIETVATQENRAVLVTGASSGIGAHIAAKFAQNGFFVYAGARKPEDIARLNQTSNMMGLKLDVTQQSDIDAAVQTILASQYDLYGLINNAGVASFAPLIEASEDNVALLMDVNVMGPYRITKAFAPLIIEHQGRISTIGSISGSVAAEFAGAYAMSKHAMEAYTDALHAEMAPFGVDVSLIAPGNYDSNLYKNMHAREASPANAQTPSRYTENFAEFSRFTQADRSKHPAPDDVANAALHAMTSTQPQRRYLVVPNQREADWVMQSLLKRTAELNHNHPFRYDRAALHQLLDQQLDAVNAP